MTVISMDQTIVSNQSKIKVAVLVVCATFFAAAFGYLASHLGDVESGQNALWVAGAFICFGALFLLETILIKGRWVMVCAAALQGLGVAWFSVVYPGSIGTIGGALVVLLLLIAGMNGQAFERSTLKVSISHIGKVMLGTLVTAGALTLGIIGVLRLGGEQFTVSERVLAGILKPSEGIIQNIIPGFSLDGNIKTVIHQNALRMLPQEIAALDAATKAEVTAQAEAQLRQSISEVLQIGIKNNDTVLGVLTKALQKQIEKIPAGYKQYLGWIGAGLIFLTIKGVGFIFVYIIEIVAWILYSISVATGFAKVVGQEITKETAVI